MKFKSILCIILFLLFAKVFAAGPVTHAYLAKQWADSMESYSFKELESFIRGTLFPDIRYLGIISRKETHSQGVSTHDLMVDTSPFSKGKKLHSFIDEKREVLVVKWGVYKRFKKIPGQRYLPTFLKLLEDEILYHKNSDWTYVRGALKSNDSGEISSQITTADVDLWHKILAPCFCMPPSEYLTQQIHNNKIFLNANIPINVLLEWVKLLPKLAAKRQNQDYVNKLIGAIESMFVVSANK